MLHKLTITITLAISLNFIFIIPANAESTQSLSNRYYGLKCYNKYDEYFTVGDAEGKATIEEQRQLPNGLTISSSYITKLKSKSKYRWNDATGTNIIEVWHNGSRIVTTRTNDYSKRVTGKKIYDRNCKVLSEKETYNLVKIKTPAERKAAKLAADKKKAEEKKADELKELRKVKEEKRVERITKKSQKTLAQRKQCIPKLESVSYLSGIWNKSNIKKSLENNKTPSPYKQAIPYILKDSDYPAITTAFNKRLNDDIKKWKRNKNNDWLNAASALNDNCLYEKYDKVVVNIGIEYEKEFSHTIGKNNSDNNLKNEVLSAIKLVPLNVIEKRYNEILEERRQKAIAKEQKMLAMVNSKETCRDKNENDEVIFSRCLKYAKNGDAPAQQYLAYLYFKGKGVKKDCKEAVKWWRKSAEQNNIRAMYAFDSYRLHYESGCDVKLTETVKWLTIAAQPKFSFSDTNAWTQYALGVIYDKGQDRIEQDQAKALKLFKMAAKQGHIYAAGKIPGRYLHGYDGVKKDMEKYKYWSNVVSEIQKREEEAHKEQLRKDREQLLARSMTETVTVDSSDKDACSQVKGLTQYLADLIATDLRTSINSIRFLQPMFASDSGCLIRIDTPNGPQNCWATRILVSKGDYLAHGSCW